MKPVVKLCGYCNIKSNVNSYFFTDCYDVVFLFKAKYVGSARSFLLNDSDLHTFILQELPFFINSEANTTTYVSTVLHLLQWHF